MEIQLGGKLGGVALVDKEDYERVVQYKWSLKEKGYAQGYIDGKYKTMHGFVMGAEKGEQVDHVNGNRLDNRKENLRVTDHIKNSQNRKVFETKTSSQYKGVYWRKDMKLYFMRVTVNGITTKIGYFDKEIIAAEVYDKFILKNKIDHAPLNFPDKKDVLIKKIHKPTKEIKKKKNKYYGVCKIKNGYQSSICIGGKTVHIKKSKDEEVCAQAYDKYVVDNNIYEKKLNFPEDYPDYVTKLNIKTLCEPYDQKSVRLVMYDQDITVLVDKDDYERIKYYKCSCFPTEYIGFSIGKKQYKLHRFVMGVTDPNIFVDHINSNPMDNRKANLRVSNVNLNGQNKSKPKGNYTSKYIGVCYREKEKLWRVDIRKGNKTILSKNFKNEEDASRYRDLFIMEKLPESHYKKNFEWTEKEIKEWKEELKFDQLKTGENTTSKYIGVHYREKEELWRASIIKNKKTVLCKQFKDEDKAARWRDLFIIEKLNDDSNYKKNFNWTDKEIKLWKKKLNFV